MGFLDQKPATRTDITTANTAIAGKVGKNEQVINVKYAPYSASGSGGGNDSAKIQSAINQAHANYLAKSGPTTVYLPAGIYNLATTAETDVVTRTTADGNGVGIYTTETVRSCVVLRSGVRLVGDGIGRTTLQRSAAGPFAVVETIDIQDGGVEDMTITGPGVTTTCHGIFLSVTQQSGNMNKNVLFKGLEIANMGYYGIGHQYGSPQNLRYEDLWIHDVGDDGIDHKVRTGPIDYLDNGTDGSFFDNILVERWGQQLTEASALDVRGQCTISNITARDFGVAGFRLYGITLSSGIANGVDKRAASARTTLTNFYVEGKVGFDCTGLHLNTGGHTQVSNGHVRWCTSYGVWARTSLGAPTQSWQNGPNIVGVTVESSRTGPSFQLETRTSLIGCRAISDYQYFDATRGNLAAGQTMFALWNAPAATRYVVKNGATLTETTDYTISGTTLTLVTGVAASDTLMVISPSSGGVAVGVNDCVVVGLDTDNFATGVSAGATALARTIQAGNRVGSGAHLSTNISGGVPRLQVVNAGSANVDLYLLPANAGLVRFGTKTTNADAPITGYVSIKDSGGGLVKLAVIA